MIGQQPHELGTRLDYADRLGQLGRDQGGVLQLAERCEEDAVREQRCYLLCGLQGQPSLADAGCS